MRCLWSVMTVLALAGTIWAQSEGSAWSYKWRQPYTWPLASHESRVHSCETPRPLDLVAMDDWI